MPPPRNNDAKYKEPWLRENWANKHRGNRLFSVQEWQAVMIRAQLPLPLIPNNIAEQLRVPPNYLGAKVKNLIRVHDYRLSAHHLTEDPDESTSSIGPEGSDPEDFVHGTPPRGIVIPESEDEEEEQQQPSTSGEGDPTINSDVDVERILQEHGTQESEGGIEDFDIEEFEFIGSLMNNNPQQGTIDVVNTAITDHDICVHICNKKVHLIKTLDQ